MNSQGSRRPDVTDRRAGTMRGVYRRVFPVCRCVLALALLLHTGCAGVFEYGKYCGLDRSDASYASKPVDDLDRACMLHDRCYNEPTTKAAGCDRAFLCRLVRARNTTTGFVPTLYRELAITYFSIPLSLRKITGYHGD